MKALCVELRECLHWNGRSMRWYEFPKGWGEVVLTTELGKCFDQIVARIRVHWE